MPTPRRRLAAIALAAALSIVPAASVAAGGKPTIEPVPFPEEGVVLPAGVFCAFEVFAEAVRNTEKAKIFPADEDGNVRQIITGQLRVEVTNVETDASIVLKISGPYEIVTAPDGTQVITFRGSSVPVIPPGLIVTTGRAVVLVHPDGSSELVSTNGRSVDVCPLIAG